MYLYILTVCANYNLFRLIELLHQVRMKVEANKMMVGRNKNLEDNYEQIGMDIVDSDGGK